MLIETSRRLAWYAWCQRVARSPWPILVGPWRSELGFETLYWLPWLAKWRATYGIAKDRLIAISRGGAGVWYEAGDTADLYDYLPLANVRRAALADLQQTGSVKQLGIADQDRAVIRLIATQHGCSRYHVLHPSRMYQDLTPWWAGTMGMQALLDQLLFQPIPVGAPPLSLALPERFLAVGFYARHTWPMDEERRDWVQALLEGLAKLIPLVVLTGDVHADEHLPFPFDGPNILSTGSACTRANNLAVQAAVLAKAVGFVGTYGGLLQLAVRLQKPALGFYTHFDGTAYAHKVLTEWIGVQQRTPVLIGRPEDAKFVQEMLQVAYVPPPLQRSSSSVAAPA